MPHTHVITGAGSGIGRAIARSLADRGDRVVLLARNAHRAETLAEEFGPAAVITADLRHPDSLAAAVAAADVPDSIDSIVHAAGIVELGPVAELSVEAWSSQLAVNLVSAAELTRLLLPAVRTARGQIVFLNSGAGLTAHPAWAAYAASKHGLKALADALRGEEAPHGVRVTTVYPGRAATPMQEKVHDQEGKTYDASRFIDPASVVAAVLMAIDLPRDAVITDLTVRPGPR